MNIEERDTYNPTFQELINYLKVLGNGYVKPDLATSGKSSSGVVRDTKKYFPYIESLNEEMCKRAGIILPPDYINRRELN